MSVVEYDWTLGSLVSLALSLREKKKRFVPLLDHADLANYFGFRSFPLFCLKQVQTNYRVAATLNKTKPATGSAYTHG